MKDPYEFEQKVKLAEFLNNFLTDKTLRVRLRFTQEDINKEEEGVPPDSILSSNLFWIKTSYKT